MTNLFLPSIVIIGEVQGEVNVWTSLNTVVKLKHTDEDVQTHHVLVAKGIVCLDVPNQCSHKLASTKHWCSFIAGTSTAILPQRLFIRGDMRWRWASFPFNLRCGLFASEAQYMNNLSVECPSIILDWVWKHIIHRVGYTVVLGSISGTYRDWGLGEVDSLFLLRWVPLLMWF